MGAIQAPSMACGVLKANARYQDITRLPVLTSPAHLKVRLQAHNTSREKPAGPHRKNGLDGKATNPTPERNKAPLGEPCGALSDKISGNRFEKRVNELHLAGLAATYSPVP